MDDDILEKIMDNAYEIHDDLSNQINLIKQVKSTYLKEILSDNVFKSQLIFRCINAILIYNLYLESDYRKKELLIDSLKEIQKDFNISDEDLLELISQDVFYENLKITDNYIIQTVKPLVLFNYVLINIGIFTCKEEYSSLQENIGIIASNIMDFIPVVSTGKQVVEVIKDLATCVSNLDKHQKYCDEIKIIDDKLEYIEMKNNLLTKIFEFLYSFDFVQENFDKSIKEFKKYV